MANAPPTEKNAFLFDLSLAEAKAKQAVSKDRANAADSVFNQCWIPFLAGLGLNDPFLSDIDDKIPILRVFAQRLREGRISRSGKPIKSPHVRDEILRVAKAYTDMGLQDPRLTKQGLMDPRLTALYKAYANEDPAPVRVKPIPLQVIQQAQQLINENSTELDRATMDMTWLGFFYMLRPGEHCKSNDNSPLQLKDVTLTIGHRKLNIFTDDMADIVRATHCSLTFDTQKNRVRGEVIGHGRSGHSIMCPTQTLIRRIKYLLSHNAQPSTPLCATKHNNRWKYVTSKLISATLKVATTALPHLNYNVTDVSARSLRSGGAMALICGNIDKDRIQLQGRWKSDAIFRYLHAQALPLVHNLASVMLQHGSFTLLPGQDIPLEAQHIVDPL